MLILALLLSITVKTPMLTDWDTQKLYIYRAECDGTYTDMDTTYNDRYVIFTTDFSAYIFVS